MDALCSLVQALVNGFGMKRKGRDRTQSEQLRVASLRQLFLPNGALLRRGAPVRLAHVVAFQTPRMAALPRNRNHDAHRARAHLVRVRLGGRSC
ncbi:hypothetical protein B0H16DRAFT_1884089, partial [Mycena metata]